MVCLSIPTAAGFPHFYYVLGANLGSLLHRDIFVMRAKIFDCGTPWRSFYCFDISSVGTGPGVLDSSGCTRLAGSACLWPSSPRLCLFSAGEEAKKM